EIDGESMKFSIVIVGFLGASLCLQSQSLQGQNPKAEQSERPTREPAANVVIPLPSSRSLSPAQLAGKKAFMQRCSACHLPPTPVGQPYGPYLDSKVIAARGDAAVREITMQGSARMPGFQYTLQPATVDNIISYLKTLVYEAAAKKYSYNPSK